MASEISGRSKFMVYNTMCCLLKALEGKHVTVEIRNDMVIEGRLQAVEANMSLNMTNVILTNVRGIKTQLAKFYVHGRQIRYVHIPDEVDIVKAMKWELNKKKFHQQKERDNKNRIFHKRQQIREKMRQKMEKKERSLQQHQQQSQQ